VADAELDALLDVRQDGCHPAMVGIGLHGRPRIVVKPRVFRLNAYEVLIAAVRDPVETTFSGMVGSSGGNHEVSPIATKAELSKRSRQIRPAPCEDVQARHVSVLWSGCVVAHYAQSVADFTATPVLPPIHSRDFQTSRL
jgi:hypothetical protein